MELIDDPIKDFPAAAEYLTTIYLLQRDYGFATNHRLSDWMGVSTSAVTQALGRLKKLGLVLQKPYEPTKLTPKGWDLATLVLKRHYLLEHLLVRMLDFPWDKADEEARVLQNQISADLADHLDEKLGFPQTCPHGNPLPGTSVEKHLLCAPSLTEAPIGSEICILRITEEGEAIPRMLPTCQKAGIKPSAHFFVVSKNDGDVELKLKGQELTVHIESVLASYIRFDLVSLA